MSDLSDPREPSEFEDSGSEYLPSDTEASTSAILDHFETPKKGKKRTRKETNWKKNIRKLKRNSGCEYINICGNIVPKKTPFVGDCQCYHKCHTRISIEQRERIFQDFYNLANFDLQTAYINSQVKVVNKGRFTHALNQNKRNKTRIYTLPADSGNMINVCKTFFKHSLKVSDGRLTRALINQTTDTGSFTPPTDKRGKHPAKNKTSSEDLENVKSFINKFARYTSHYSRCKNPNREYLSPDLNITKLYSLYVESEDSVSKVSKFIFSKIFNEDFNLHFRYPATDTCKKCDNFNIQLKNVEGAEKKKVEVEKEIHLRMAEAARKGMKDDPNINPDTTTCIAFDLMKTLPTPNISTGVAYYKRQLWTYCLGIHNLRTKKAHMYVWHEGIASRGPEEIGSCLMHYIKNFVTTPNLIMYSDQCGGQNRNIKMAAICMYVVASSDFTPNVIDHKFLVSGHSYLPCDRDFGTIEKQKRFVSEIYVPMHWIKVISSARKSNKFEIIKMEKEDFKSTKKLEILITNRKKGEGAVKVEWLKIQWLRFKAEESFNIYYKYSNNDGVMFNNVNVAKRGIDTRQLQEDVHLDLLYPTGRPIDKLKFKDLQSLLPYIPQIFYDFYQNLNTNNNAQDEDIVEESEDE